MKMIKCRVTPNNNNKKKGVVVGYYIRYLLLAKSGRAMQTLRRMIVLPISLSLSLSLPVTYSDRVEKKKSNRESHTATTVHAAEFIDPLFSCWGVRHTLAGFPPTEMGRRPPT